MPHNNGRVYRNTSVSPAQGVDFISDIAYVLGVGSGAIGYIITNGVINKFAKFKAFGYPSWGFADNAARNEALRKTRYGFSTSSGHIAPHTDESWVYTKPTGNAAQPFRALDFDGYYHYAPCPFRMESTATKGTGSIYSAKGSISAVLYANGAVSQSWNSNDCMSIQDFFDAETTPGTDDLWDYYHIAFRIVNKSRGYTHTVIETNSTLKSSFQNQNTAAFNFPEVDYQSDWNYLAVLSEAQLGDTLEVSAFIMNPTGTMTNAYKVHTGSTADAYWSSGFSLAFNAGVDRHDATVASVYSMNGTVGTLTGVTNRNDGTVTIYGLPARKYFTTLSATIDTRAASAWSSVGTIPADFVIEVRIISLDTAQMFFCFDLDPTHTSAVSDTYEGSTRVITWRNTVRLGSQRISTVAMNLFSYGQYVGGQPITDPDFTYIARPTSGSNTATIQITARLERPGDNTVYLGSYGPFVLKYNP